MTDSGSVIQPPSRLVDIIPRWRICLGLFAALTIVTIFLPATVAWILFILVTLVVILRGYRASDIASWALQGMRAVVFAALLGTLIWTVAHNLQRDGLIRLSRDVYIRHPEWFLCCIWDDTTRTRRYLVQ